MYFAPRFVSLAVLLLGSNLLCAAEPSVKRLEAPGIENFFSVTDSIYSGGSPETEESFQALAKMGIKTIITVDGARPNVELARRFGLRYIHLPHGYDGIPKDTAIKLVKAATTADGPIYVHCHHGKHRGPAAVGVICESLANWSPQDAESWMKMAGTAVDYVGLYRSVRENRPPNAEELAKVPADFPETAEVSALVDTMVEIDQRWDRLRELLEHKDQADKTASEVTLLWEQFREAQRLPESAALGTPFQSDMARSEQAALHLRDMLTARSKGAELSATNLRRAVDGVATSCKNCHESYRNSTSDRYLKP
jgi:protein tyrosine phosphatase (PTP) superfamily phosphohydrolase (DUF442 family)